MMRQTMVQGKTRGCEGSRVMHDVRNGAAAVKPKILSAKILCCWESCA